MPPSGRSSKSSSSSSDPTEYSDWLSVRRRAQRSVMATWISPHGALSAWTPPLRDFCTFTLASALLEILWEPCGRAAHNLGHKAGPLTPTA